MPVPGGPHTGTTRRWQICRKASVWLSVKPNAALLYIERVSYSQNDVPVEFLRIYYRADRYVLYNELSGGAG